MSDFKTIMSRFRDEMVVEIKEQESMREFAIADHKVANIAYEMIGRQLGKEKPDNWMTKTIKRTKLQEKLYRYAHNLNIEKVEKYDRKLHELDMEHMEDFRENPEKYAVVMFDDTTGRVDERVTNEGAYLRFCKDAKFQFEKRAKLVKFIKMLIEVKSHKLGIKNVQFYKI